MISDVLYNAVREIDGYLKESSMYQDQNGKPDPEFVKVRDEMFKLLLDLDYPDERLTPEMLEKKHKVWLVEKATPEWRPFMND